MTKKGKKKKIQMLVQINSNVGSFFQKGKANFSAEGEGLSPRRK